MLAGLDPLVILYMPCDSSQDDLFHQLPQHRVRLVSHSSLSLSSYVRFSKPSDIFIALSWTQSSMSMSLVLGSPALDTALQMCQTSLDVLVTLCLIQPRRRLTSFAAKVHCWLMFNLVSTRIPQSFSAKMLASCEPQLALVPEVISHQDQDFTVPFLGLHEVPLGPILQPLSMLSMTPYGMEQLFGQLGSAVPAVSPPNSLCPPAYSLEHSSPGSKASLSQRSGTPKFNSFTYPRRLKLTLSMEGSENSRFTRLLERLAAEDDFPSPTCMRTTVDVVNALRSGLMRHQASDPCGFCHSPNQHTAGRADQALVGICRDPTSSIAPALGPAGGLGELRQWAVPDAAWSQDSSSFQHCLFSAALADRTSDALRMREAVILASQLNNPSSLSRSSSDFCSRPFTSFIALLWTRSSTSIGGPKTEHKIRGAASPVPSTGDDHFPTPAGHAISDTSQDAVGFLGHLGTLLAHIQAAVNQHPQVLLCQAAFQPLFPKPVALHGVVVAQVQDLALGLVKPHTIDLGPSIQPVQVPLQSLPTLKQINTPAQLGVICKLTEGALDPFVQIIDKDIKQNWPQHRALGNTACDRPPTGVNSIHHHTLGPAIQPVLFPAKSTPVQAMSSQFLQENAELPTIYGLHGVTEAHVAWAQRHLHVVEAIRHRVYCVDYKAHLGVLNVLRPQSHLACRGTSQSEWTVTIPKAKNSLRKV
ncbi:hypothetical protein QYF61_004763 [Mycteria americana]|uniref:Uncharacterized protein n=1 Tax=Mycteria americana TaxID=33587 RepID=A0AAN7SII0_MYCAM|nr:hypothetical protein QYF61_004763 [Mycteria americana]